MKLEEAVERCKELIKSEHDRWIGLTNQEAIKTVLQALENSVSKDEIREILKYYGHTPADNPDTTIAFYSDVKKLLRSDTSGRTIF